MKETLKKNWKGITATVVAFGAVCGAIYYVNCIHLPGRQQAEATKLTAIQPVAPPKDYNFTVNTANSQTADTSTDSSGSSTNPADDRIKVTTDGDGTVTIDRTWDAEPGELDTTSTAPSSGSTTATPSTDSTKSSDSTTTPSTPSTLSSSTPKDGDTRVVDGQEQEYWDGFGWVDKGDGGHTDYIGNSGDQLSGIQVGEMG